jgi:hypothetical protein
MPLAFIRYYSVEKHAKANNYNGIDIIPEKLS